jgi:hypothetical protein
VAGARGYQVSHRRCAVAPVFGSDCRALCSLELRATCVHAVAAAPSRKLHFTDALRDIVLSYPQVCVRAGCEGLSACVVDDRVSSWGIC